MMDSFLTNMLHKTLTDGMESCGLLVDCCDCCFYQPFGLSFWRHPFTAEDALWASDVMLNFSKSVLMKKQTHLHLGWREVERISSKFSRLSKLFLQRVLIYLDKTVYRFIWSAACHYIKWNSGLFDCPAHIWWYALCIIHYEGHLQSFGTATEQCLCVSGVFSNSIPRPSEIWIN